MKRWKDLVRNGIAENPHTHDLLRYFGLSALLFHVCTWWPEMEVNNISSCLNKLLLFIPNAVLATPGHAKLYVTNTAA